LQQHAVGVLFEQLRDVLCRLGVQAPRRQDRAAQLDGRLRAGPLLEHAVDVLLRQVMPPRHMVEPGTHQHQPQVVRRELDRLAQILHRFVVLLLLRPQLRAQRVGQRRGLLLQHPIDVLQRLVVLLHLDQLLGHSQPHQRVVRIAFHKAVPVADGLFHLAVLQIVQRTGLPDVGVVRSELHCPVEVGQRVLRRVRQLAAHDERFGQQLVIVLQVLDRPVHRLAGAVRVAPLERLELGSQQMRWTELRIVLENPLEVRHHAVPHLLELVVHWRGAEQDRLGHAPRPFVQSADEQLPRNDLIVLGEPLVQRLLAQGGHLSQVLERVGGHLEVHRLVQFHLPVLGRERARQQRHQPAHTAPSHRSSVHPAFLVPRPASRHRPS